MTWMPRRTIFLLAGSALLLAPLLAVQLATGGGRAHACSCIPPPPPLEALDRASAVFTGTVGSFRTLSFEAGSEDWPGPPYWSVEFEVDVVWEGSVTTTTVVYVTQSSACGYGNFEIGTDFLVYAHQRDLAGVGDDTLFVSSCSRTVPLERAEADLLALGAGKAPRSGITGIPPAPGDEAQNPTRDRVPSLAWWAPLLAGIAAAAIIVRRWAGRRELE